MHRYSTGAIAAAAQVSTVKRSAVYKLCWDCQCSKSTAGGKIKLLPGFHKFVCKECVEAAQIKRAARTAAA
jgi:hypothetical protein